MVIAIDRERAERAVALSVFVIQGLPTSQATDLGTVDPTILRPVGSGGLRETDERCVRCLEWSSKQSLYIWLCFNLVAPVEMERRR